MPLCFAYGSNMDVAAMRARCQGARVIGRARLASHRLAIMRSGWLTIKRDARRTVHGLLWQLGPADVGPLDRYEDVASGLYRKRLMPVLTAAGPRQALVYVGRDAGLGLPRPGYLDGVLAAAAAAGLPPGYVAELRALGAPPPRRGRAQTALSRA